MTTNPMLSPISRVLRGAACCACLLVAEHHARADCEPSFNVTGTGEVVDGTMVGPSGAGVCQKTDVHIEKDRDELRELRSHTNTINSDGSANPLGEDTRMILNREQWRIDSRDGEYGQFGGEWPDDAYTRRIPNPNMELAFATVNKKNNSFGAVFKRGTVSIDRMKDYVEKLKARGFTINAKVSESVRLGTYGYHAKNSAGYRVQAGCIRVLCELSLESPKD
jgi:hypothetical protein